MKLVSTTLLLILTAASAAFSFGQQDDQTIGTEPNYKRVNGFIAYLTLDDYPVDHVKEWLDPVEIETMSAMPTMKRGKTMGAFVELMGCKPNVRRVCNVEVAYTIYKPDNSIFTTRTVGQREILWKKQGPRISSRPALARMHFKLRNDDPAGEYKVKAKVSDLNANISFEIELNFHLAKPD